MKVFNIWYKSLLLEGPRPVALVNGCGRHSTKHGRFPVSGTVAAVSGDLQRIFTSPREALTRASNRESRRSADNPSQVHGERSEPPWHQPSHTAEICLRRGTRAPKLREINANRRERTDMKRTRLSQRSQGP